MLFWAGQPRSREEATEPRYRKAAATKKKQKKGKAAATAAAGEVEQTKAEAAKVVRAAEKQTADAIADARGRAKALTGKADKEADALLKEAKKLLK